MSAESNERTSEAAAMTTVTRTADTAASGVTAQSAGLQPFQVQFIKNMIEDSLDEFKYDHWTCVHVVVGCDGVRVVVGAK